MKGDPSNARDMADYIASPANYRAYGAMDHVLWTGQEGFAHVNGMDLWDWFDAHPEELATFARMSEEVSRGEAPIIARIYPFPERGKVCDIGGGSGTLLAGILLRHPRLSGVIFDRPSVQECALVLTSERGVAARCTFIGGVFWDQVPEGYDLYLQKNILHDWHDKKCEVLLRNIAKAATRQSRLLIVEILVEGFDATNYGSLRYVHVMTVCNSTFSFSTCAVGHRLMFCLPWRQFLFRLR